jgi:hypothetical protein
MSIRLSYSISNERKTYSTGIDSIRGLECGAPAGFRSPRFILAGACLASTVDDLVVAYYLCVNP